VSEALREDREDRPVSPWTRAAAGRERVRLAGGRLGGQPNYGERPGEAAPAWLMVHLAGKGWSMQRIADELERLEIPSRSGDRWHRGSVHVVVRRAREAARETDTG
jgi:hypothetical protein